jgi:23S rRNA pseudouridine2457 synthase
VTRRESEFHLVDHDNFPFFSPNSSGTGGTSAVPPKGKFNFFSRGFASIRGGVLVAFHKPYGVLSRFTPDGSPHQTLAGFGFPPNIYPIGRLDADSEGLLLLSDEAALTAALLDPRAAHPRLYWAQVERIPTAESLQCLAAGLTVQGRRTLSCRAWLLAPPPAVAPRNPPIRFRKSVPDTWIALELIEGKNRQVRRMTAAIGHPTLRLMRVRIGQFSLGDLAAGQWRELTAKERDLVRKR